MGVFLTSQKFKGIQISYITKRIQGKGIPRIAWELEFRRLLEFPISRVLEDWWCCGCLGLNIRVIKGIFFNHNNL